MSTRRRFFERSLRSMRAIGLLRHSPTRSRGRAAVVHANCWMPKTRKAMTDWIGGFAKLAKSLSRMLNRRSSFASGLAELAEADRRALAVRCLQPMSPPHRIADYLFDELTQSPKQDGCQRPRRRNCMNTSSAAIPEADREKLLDRCDENGQAIRYVRSFWHAIGPMRFLQTHAQRRRSRSGRVAIVDELAWIILIGGHGQR